MPSQLAKKTVTQYHILVIGAATNAQKDLFDSLNPQVFSTTFYEHVAELHQALNKKTSFENPILIIDESLLVAEQFSLLSSIKQKTPFLSAPYILMTDSNKNESIEKSLKNNVHYFLIKPFNLPLLKSVVETVIETQGITQPSNIMKNRGTFHVKTIAEAQATAHILASLTPNPASTEVGLSELIFNAIEHGNLNIGYQLKSALIQQNSLKEEIDKRLTQTENQEKSVRVMFNRTQNQIEFAISDEGEGFAHSEFIESDKHQITEKHGRGIMIANHISFDSIEYRDHGRTAVCRLNIEPD